MFFRRKGTLGASVPDGRTGAISGARRWLSLAAAPTFAVMAALAHGSGPDAAQMLCMPTSGPSWLTGMLPMYVLMATFHSGPWLGLLSRRNDIAAPVC